MVHVDDLVAGLVSAAQSPNGGGTWFLTDGEPHTWSEIARALQEAAGRRVRILTVPDAVVHVAGAANEAIHRCMGRSALFDRAKARDLTARGWVCSSEAASKAFAYDAGVDLRAGMRATMEWYRKVGWL
jgi:nucleoside-diphosphate-sugar epimerase